MPATAVGSAKGRSTNGVEQAPAGKAVADQHPGDDHAEDGVDDGRDQSRPKLRRSAASVRGSVAIAQKSGQPESRRLQHEPGQAE